jgi:octaprenyl-diphosphate synthase
VDDALDYGGQSGTLGKNTGDDLREGKMTLPIILALAEGNEAERATITSALGDADATAEQVAEVVAILERHKTLARTLDQAQTHARSAQQALKALPASDMGALLADVVEFSVLRAY